MATLIRSVTVKLRAGVLHAVLPDNRSMKANTNYSISFEDYQKIGANALGSVIQVVSMDTTPKALTGDDLTNNTVGLPNVPNSSPARARKIGDVVDGVEVGTAFKLVKLADAVNATAGMSATWVNKVLGTVTVDRVGGTAAVPLEFAGVFNSAVTAGRYGWMQIAGLVGAAVATAEVTAGRPVAVHPTTDGSLTSADQSEVQTVVLTAYDATDTYKLEYPAGSGVKTVAFVRGTNHTQVAIQAGLEAIPAIGVGNVLVGAVLDTGYTVTFQGALLGNDVGLIAVTDMTAGDTGVVTETAKGGLPSATRPIGAAVTNVGGGVSDVVLRSRLARNRHDHRRQNIFHSP